MFRSHVKFNKVCTVPSPTLGLRRRQSSSVTPSESPPRLDTGTESDRFLTAERSAREKVWEEQVERLRLVRVQEAADRAAQEAAMQNRLKKMAGVVYTGDLLGPGELPNSHLVRVENLMGSDNKGRFEYPAGHAAATTFDGRAGSRACQFLMTSLEADMAADLQEKDGQPVADDEHQLQVQACEVPDDAALVFEMFSRCTFNQLATVLRRNAMGSATVDSLITELEGEVYEPAEDLGAWFNEQQRQYRGRCRCGTSRKPSRSCCLMLPGITQRCGSWRRG